MKAKLVRESLNELFGFNKKNKNKEFKEKNESILKMIYDKLDLKWTEGEFDPKTWVRQGNTLNDGRNDELITNFTGINLSQDLKTGEFSLGMPPKFKRELGWQLMSEFEDMGYTITREPDFNEYWTIIKFK